MGSSELTLTLGEKHELRYLSNSKYCFPRARHTLSFDSHPYLKPSLRQGGNSRRGWQTSFPGDLLTSMFRNELVVTDGSGLMLNRKGTLFSISEF